jgi:hypothetical protein
MLTFSIITITAFVSFLDTLTIAIMKNFVKGDFKKFIPLFSLAYGLGLGIAGYYTPNVDMGANIIEAIFIGLSAGAAATGVDQVGKQLGKKDELQPILDYVKLFMNSTTNETHTDIDPGIALYNYDEVQTKDPEDMTHIDESIIKEETTETESEEENTDEPSEE